MPNHTASRAAGHLEAQSSIDSNGVFAVFVASTAAVTGSYVLGAMTLSLGAQVARDVVASSNALVNGGTIALFAIASAVATVPARKLTPSKVILAGGVTAIGSSALLALAAVQHSLRALYVGPGWCRGGVQLAASGWSISNKCASSGDTSGSDIVGPFSSLPIWPRLSWLFLSARSRPILD